MSGFQSGIPILACLVGFALGTTGSSRILAQEDAAKLYQQAQDAEQRQDWAGAAQAYRELLKVAPELPELFNNLGIALHYQGRYRESAEWLRKALAKKPEMTGARLFLGLDHYLLGEYGPAILDLTEVARREPDNTAALLHLGAAQLASGAPSDAIPTLESALRQNQDDLETLHTLAQAYLAQSKALFDQGKGIYEKILEKAPNSARTHQILAEAFLSQDQPEKAIESYQRAIELKPDDAILRAALGETYFQLGKHTEARRELEQALRLQPNHAKANLELAVIDNLERKFEDALARLDQAAAGMDKVEDLYIERAKAQAGLGRNGPAVESLKTALALNPGNGPAHYQLAQLYRAAGETELARRHLQEFTRLEREAEAIRQSEAKRFLQEKKP